MQITVQDFHILAKAAHNNKSVIHEDAISEINKTYVSLYNEEFDTILKRKTIKRFIKLAFGNEYYDSNFLAHLDDKLAATSIDSDVALTVSRKQLDDMDTAFKMEFSDTNDQEQKEKMVKCARDVSTYEIDKIDTVDLSDEVVKSLKNAELHDMKEDVERVLLKYESVPVKRPKFK